MYRGHFIGVEASVLQSCRAFNLTEVPDLHVLKVARIDNRGVYPDVPHRRRDTVNIFSYEFLQLLNEFRTVTVECHNVCRLCSKAVKDDDLTPSGLVEDRRLHSVSER